MRWPWLVASLALFGTAIALMPTGYGLLVFLVLGASFLAFTAALKV